MADDDTNRLLLVIIAILIPPLGVYLKEGLGLHFFLNIILTLMGFVPGQIHALWRILR